METKHTPCDCSMKFFEKWEKGRLITKEGNGFSFCTLHKSAPELLEACKTAHVAISVLAKAIAKAEGD